MKILRIILLVINIIAAVGLILTTLASSVAPSRSIWPSLLAYGYLPMLALNVAFVILWLFMGRWEFLLSVAVIVFRFSFIGFFFQVGGTSKVPPTEEHPAMVTLMTFNVHQFGGNGKEAIPKDSIACEFLLLVREHTPDVLCLQEFSNPKKVKVVDSLELMGYNHYYSASGSSTTPAGTAVFSRLPIMYVKKIDRQKIMVEILRGDRPFRLCCVHMDSYAFDDADKEEISQMALGKVDSSSRRTLSKVKETILRHETEWNEMLGRIRGFRKFLVTAEKPRLEMLVAESPSYFYDILPYTYVLGVTSAWIRKFDKIAMKPPGWYTSSWNDGNPDWVGDSLNRTMDRIGSDMTSAPASSGSSGGWSSSSSSGSWSSSGSSGGGHSW